MSMWLLQHSRSIAHTNTEANPGEEADVAGTAEEVDPVVRQEPHRSGRVGWLRAAVLGAEDGIVSTASLVIGVAAAAAARRPLPGAGLARVARGVSEAGRGVLLGHSPPRRRTRRYHPRAPAAAGRPRPGAGRAHRHLR